MLLNHLRYNWFHAISNFHLSLYFRIFYILFAFLQNFIEIFNNFVQDFLLLVRSNEWTMHQLLSANEHNQVFIFKFLLWINLIPRLSIFLNFFFLKNEIQNLLNKINVYLFFLRDVILLFFQLLSHNSHRYWAKNTFQNNLSSNILRCFCNLKHLTN